MNYLTRIKEAVPWAAAATVPFATFKTLRYWAGFFSYNTAQDTLVSYLGSTVIGGAAMGIGAAIEKILSLDTYPFEELTYGVIAGTIGGVVEYHITGDGFYDTAWKVATLTALTILTQKKMGQEATSSPQSQNSAQIQARESRQPPQQQGKDKKQGLIQRRKSGSPSSTKASST